jgi:hypothetical protein
MVDARGVFPEAMEHWCSQFMAHNSRRAVGCVIDLGYPSTLSYQGRGSETITAGSDFKEKTKHTLRAIFVSS